MVNFASLSLLALGLASSQALAAPTVTATKSKAVAERFSFAKWVDSIIANPDAALSPQEAWQAYLDSVNSTTTTSPSSGAIGPAHDKRWDSQVNCKNYGGGNQAKAVDAVVCINYLAAAGQVPCTAHKKTSTSGSGLSTWVYCLYGTAMLGPYGSDYTDPTGWGTCQSIAQTAGAIMDTCTEPNGMVTGARASDLAGTKQNHLYPEYPLSILVYDAFQTAMLMPQRAGNASEDPNNRGTCQNIAQTAAVVMDRCTQANGTVTGLTDDDVTGTKVGVFIAKNPGDFAWP